jgi:hypothetical protein
MLVEKFTAKACLRIAASARQAQRLEVIYESFESIF